MVFLLSWGYVGVNAASDDVSWTEENPRKQRIDVLSPSSFRSVSAFSSNKQLVASLMRRNNFRKEVEEAMLQTDRKLYSTDPRLAYVDSPHGIGYS